MSENSEVIKFYIVAIVLSIFFVGFIIAFALLYKRQQSKLLIEKELEETQLRNEILEKEIQRVKAIQTERDRISRDLHDEIGAGLSAIKLQAEFMKKTDEPELLDEIIVDSQELTASMKEIVWSLNARYDTIENFASYTKEFAKNFFNRSDIQLHIEVQEQLPSIGMSSLIRRNVFLIIKEALHNIIKHSRAQNARLSIHYTDRLQIEIHDDGQGMDVENDDGNGLLNMKNRAQDIGAQLDFFSEKGNTILQLESQLELT